MEDLPSHGEIRKSDGTGKFVRSVFALKTDSPRPIPLALESVHAGFPSAAQDYFLDDFSFDEHVITHPSTTFAVVVAGDSMEGAGIYDNDILLVDRGLDPYDTDVVVAIVDADMTVKRLCVPASSSPYLHPENPKYPDINLNESSEISIWGVAIGSYHHLHHPHDENRSTFGVRDYSSIRNVRR